MSEYPTIKEGGISRVFGGTDKLITPLQAGGSCAWVPESKTRLATKSIDKNGIYVAADDGDYGWSSVTVSVSTNSGVTGKGEDGEQHYVAPDQETGELVDTIVPSSIQIVIPPTKLTYTDGETIDFTGAVVKAYYATGGEWGEVPIEEITIYPTVAVYEGGENGYYSNGEGVNAYLITTPTLYDENANRYRSNETLGIFQDHPCTMGAKKIAFFYLTKSGNYVYAMSALDENYDLHIVTNNSGKWRYAGNLTYPARPHYWNLVSTANTFYNIPESTGNLSGYFDRLEHQVGSPQTITVLWPRPGDGLTLETSYGITVTAITGGGGQAGDNGTGRND